jgi:hypothetical protein
MFQIYNNTEIIYIKIYKFPNLINFAKMKYLEEKLWFATKFSTKKCYLQLNFSCKWHYLESNCKQHLLVAKINCKKN